MNLRNLRDSGTWLPTLAIAAGLLVAACLPKDSDNEGRGDETGYWDTGYYDYEDDEDDEGEDHPAFINGLAAVYIQEFSCAIAWDISGAPVSGYDLMWEVDGTVSASTDCLFGEDISNTLEVTAGAVYFGVDYWGAASYGGGTLDWTTAGYVYGAGGYTYYYYGYGLY